MCIRDRGIVMTYGARGLRAVERVRRALITRIRVILIQRAMLRQVLVTRQGISTPPQDGKEISLSTLNVTSRTVTGVFDSGSRPVINLTTRRNYTLDDDDLSVMPRRSMENGKDLKNMTEDHSHDHLQSQRTTGYSDNGGDKENN
eukprot:TRINITY_DN25862_c0_g1_i1.p1 TRINITY_DN25862_c0_g1~~TRINITY_DN25862_c0_g1_i1.p1  ORF type:complete len:164 (-),score=22.19 TRINITY_DN25862_c0_g1_i1:62-496(-)